LENGFNNKNTIRRDKKMFTFDELELILNLVKNESKLAKSHGLTHYDDCLEIIEKIKLHFEECGIDVD
jgi:hypothetical protein